MFCQQATAGLQAVLVNLIPARLDVYHDLLPKVVWRFDLAANLAIVEFLSAPVYLFVANTRVWHSDCPFWVPLLYYTFLAGERNWQRSRDRQPTNSGFAAGCIHEWARRLKRLSHQSVTGAQV
jgi:hypothetical protein